MKLFFAFCYTLIVPSVEGWIQLRFLASPFGRSHFALFHPEPGQTLIDRILQMRHHLHQTEHSQVSHVVDPTHHINISGHDSVPGNSLKDLSTSQYQLSNSGRRVLFEVLGLLVIAVSLWCLYYFSKRSASECSRIDLNHISKSIELRNPFQSYGSVEQRVADYQLV
jgi:hypothetical protein